MTDQLDVEGVVSAVKRCQVDEHQVVSCAVIGHKADVGILALGPDLWRLRRLQTDLAAAGLEAVNSYVSLTEVSEYAAGMPAEMLQPRLYPQLPPEGKRAVCFYPMSKRRVEGANWFRLDFEERKRLMLEHGTTGRTFRGRVLQLITGSTGVDDFEWFVTLFAADPADLKACVYTMRYDEASAVYVDFGWFVTGLVAGIDEVLAEVTRNGPG